MMKIRSVTCLLEPGWPPDLRLLDEVSKLVSSARQAFASAGYEVQTARLATPPFPLWLSGSDPDWLAEKAFSLEKAVLEFGIEYLSLGPALPSHPESYHQIPPALAVTQNIFFSGLTTLEGGGVSLPAIHACARIIQEAGGITPDGFTNLRFAALANVPAGGAFFPAAYHAGGKPGFALATEAADLAVQAFNDAESLDQARQRLVKSVEGHAAVLGKLAETLASQTSFDFLGFDFTLAPFPRFEQSIGAALEMLGVPALGKHGSLAVAAFLMDTLDRARYLRAGFNGLFLPVLEDAVLAQRSAQGTLSLKDILLFSTVCGTGLDTIPLPGDTTASQIAAVLLDLSVLAQRLDKPLTARLMPVPNMKAGDLTQFDFPYFANSRVLSLDSEPLRGLLVGDETFYILPRITRR